MFINILAILVPIISIFIYIAVKESSKTKVEPTKCGCGKSESGYCDGSHNELPTPKDPI